MRISTPDIVLFLPLLLSLSDAYTTTTTTTTTTSLLGAGPRSSKTYLFPRTAFVASRSGATSRIPTIRTKNNNNNNKATTAAAGEASKSTRLFSSQWDEEENDDESGGATKTSPTYEEAGRAIGEEDDQEKMDDLGDFDESPNVSSCRAYPTEHARSSRR